MRQLAGTVQNSPPNPQEVEVSLFGPGFGECVVLHLGKGEWVVVDSCRDADTGLPAAIDYLQKLDVDLATSVRLVVATHWHDDHMDGLADLFRACRSAKFVCSMALNCEEWFALSEVYRGYLQAGGSGVDELRQTMQELKRRNAANAVVAPQFALAKQPLYVRANGMPAEVVALSPSNAAVAVMQAHLQQRLLPQEKQRRLRVPDLRENDGSVVLSMRVGSASVLLGADLEERGRPGLGWQAILDEYETDAKGYEGMKIPHHGSETGHHPQQWSRLMSQQAWATLTPCNRGTKLPTPEDCRRILSHTEDSFITSPRGLGKFRHPDAAVMKTVQEATLSIGIEPGKQGHIRLRRNALGTASEWEAELFGNALPLRRILHLVE
ncbi:MAG: MBL fold metallo-hydrolase [Verrucomicrobia bacterium]|nr:MBL fold metallo-hydrolase [Verrucomicrobiota bacterium]